MIGEIPPSISPQARLSGGLNPLASGRQSNEDDHGSRDHKRRGDPAECQPALCMLLGERVAERGPEGPRQNVSGPEEDAFREAGEEMGRGHERDQAREH